MAREDEVVGAIVGIFLGLLGIAILAELFTPRCPRCRNRVEQGTTICPHCGTWIGLRPR